MVYFELGNKDDLPGAGDKGSGAEEATKSVAESEVAEFPREGKRRTGSRRLRLWHL